MWRDLGRTVTQVRLPVEGIWVIVQVDMIRQEIQGIQRPQGNMDALRIMRIMSFLRARVDSIMRFIEQRRANRGRRTNRLLDGLRGHHSKLSRRPSLGLSQGCYGCRTGCHDGSHYRLYSYDVHEPCRQSFSSAYHCV